MIIYYGNSRYCSPYFSSRFIASFASFNILNNLNLNYQQNKKAGYLVVQVFSISYFKYSVNDMFGCSSCQHIIFHLQCQWFVDIRLSILSLFIKIYYCCTADYNFLVLTIQGFNSEQLCFCRMHVIQDPQSSNFSVICRKTDCKEFNVNIYNSCRSSAMYLAFLALAWCWISAFSQAIKRNGIQPEEKKKILGNARFYISSL